MRGVIFQTSVITPRCETMFHGIIAVFQLVAAVVTLVLTALNRQPRPTKA